jgi:hypothetical protein
MTDRARGAFEVTVTPQPPGGKAGEANLGRLWIDKKFHGDLEGTSLGEMLAAATEVEGSAGYVAMERFTGTLAGRGGTFALQHGGTMTRGVPRLEITVVPDSGTGELAGLSGHMSIEITDRKHFYDFRYSLPGRE